jgi:hypothetical protein
LDLVAAQFVIFASRQLETCSRKDSQDVLNMYGNEGRIAVNFSSIIRLSLLLNRNAPTHLEVEFLAI